MIIISNKLKDYLGKVNEEKNKSDIERIISDYRHEWDIYTELIQNSCDAIIDKFGFNNIFQGEIKVTIDTEDRKLVIEDNGIGIKEEDLSRVLVNGESIKRQNNKGKFGFMGFGLTFVAFQSKYIQVESVKDGIRATRTYKNLYKYVFDDKDVPESEEETYNIESSETDEDSWTKLTVQFPLNFPKSSIEKNLQLAFEYAKYSKVIEYILRTKTPVGLIDTLFSDFKNFSFELTVDENLYNIENKYLSTRDIIKKLMPSEQRLYDMDKEFKAYLLMTDRLPEAQKTTARKCILLDTKIENIKIGTSKPINARVYLAATSKENLNSYYEEIGFKGIVDESGEVIGQFKINNGLWLAINGLPTGICIDEYDHSTFLPFSGIIDIQDKEFRSELDSGRKGITPYRVKQIQKVVRDILREQKFMKYKSYVINVDSRITDPLYNPVKELSSIFRTKKYYNIDLCHKYLPPHEEQEVISIFTELISKKILLGYTPKVLSGYQVYDGLYGYNLASRKECLYSENNKYGIKQEVFDRNSGVLEADLLIEFKRDLDQIYKDVNNNIKDLSDINILVCWDVDISRKDIYDEVEGDILKERIIENNPYFGVTHHLITQKRQQPLPIIELKSLIEYYFKITINQ